VSISLMALAFKAAVPATQKLVLLALCDCANDQGECYPSVPTLTTKCSLSERAIQGAFKELEAGGYLAREMRTGRATVYWVTPAGYAPPQELRPTPAPTAPPPPQDVRPTPAGRAPITINEPSVEPPRKQKPAQAPAAVGPVVLVAAGFDEATAAEFIEHKARVKAPLTVRAWADHLAESRKAGWTPQDAAVKVMAKNWKGFEAKYVASEAPPGAPPKPQAKPAWIQEREATVNAWMGSCAPGRRGQQTIEWEGASNAAAGSD
jgi:hypothetical protein